MTDSESEERAAAENYRRWQEYLNRFQDALSKTTGGLVREAPRRRRTSTADDTADDTTGASCPICLEEMNGPGVCVLPCCRNSIHQRCLDQLRERSGRGTELARRCPNCREPLLPPADQLVVEAGSLYREVCEAVRRDPDPTVNWQNLPQFLQAKMNRVVHLSRLATKQNDADVAGEACLALADLYLEGRGVKADCHEAYRLLYISSQTYGNTGALRRLQRVFPKGQPQDPRAVIPALFPSGPAVRITSEGIEVIYIPKVEHERRREAAANAATAGRKAPPEAAPVCALS